MLSLAIEGNAGVDIQVAGNSRDVPPVANELKRYLKLITGAGFQTGHNDAGGKIVLKIRPELLDGFGSTHPRVREVISWQCDGRATLEIAGNNSSALWLSMYAFLEEIIGCRWFFPGKTGEDIPRRSVLKIGKISVVKTPSFIVRDFRFGWPLRPKKATKHLQAHCSYWPIEYQRKKLAGGFCLGDVHAYSKIIPRHVLDAHPEYTCLINGKRQKEAYQLCVTNKKVEDLAVQYCLDYFAANPGETTVSLGANDNNIFCECRRCVEANLGRKLGGKGRAAIPHSVSRSIFEFSNRVAARVAKSYPYRYLVVLAYARTKAPPVKLKIHDNVIVWYCSLAFSRVSPSEKQQASSEIEGWTRIAKNVGLFEYVVNQAWPGLHRPFTEELAHSMKFMHRSGLRYFYTQHADDFGVNLPNYYLVTALGWDVKQNPKKLLDDFYRRCFRESAAPVKKYFEIMESAIRAVALREPGPGNFGVTGSRRPHEQVCVIFHPEIMRQAETFISEAKRMASTKVARERLKLVADAFGYLKLTVELSRKTFNFENKYYLPALAPRAWNIGNYDYNTAVQKLELFGKPCIADLKELIRGWQAHEALRKKLSNTYALNEFWSRGAKFGVVPMERLQNTWKLFAGKIDHVPLVVKAKHPVRVL